MKQSPSLDASFRAFGNDLSAFVQQHVFRAATIDPHGESFLAAHFGQLDTYDLFVWLRYRAIRAERESDASIDALPSDAVPTHRVRAALLERLSTGEVATRFVESTLLLDPIEETLLDDLAEALFTRVEPRLRYPLLRRMNGGSLFTKSLPPPPDDPSFWIVLDRIAPTQRDYDVAADLIDCRRDDRECARRLSSAATRTDLDRRVVALATLDRIGRLDLVTDVSAALRGIDAFADLRFFGYAGAVSECDARRAQWVRKLAAAWPSANGSRAVEWLVDEAIRARASGQSWQRIVPVLSEDVVARMAVRCLEEGIETPWLAAGLSTALRKGDLRLWIRALEWMEHYLARRQDGEEDDADEIVYAVVGANGKRDVGYWSNTESSRSLLFGATLPSDPPSEFDERFDRCARLLPYANQIDAQIYDRLSTLPLTRDRANRLLRLALGDVALTRIPSREILDAADPIPPSELPHPGMVVLSPPFIATYRALGGEARLVHWIAQAFAEEETWPEAIVCLKSAPDLITPDLAERLRAVLRSASFRQVSLTRWAFPQLVPDGIAVTPPDALITQTRARLERTLDYKEFERIVHENGDAVGVAFVADVARRRLDQRAAVVGTATLDWLIEHRVDLERVFEIGAAALEFGAGRKAIATWLGSRLSSGNAWHDLGARVADTLLRVDQSSVSALLSASQHAAAERETGKAENATSGTMTGMHSAFASALVRRATLELEEGRPRAASRTLLAMTNLKPRAGIGRELAELRHRVSANDPLVEVVDGLMAAFKHRDKKDAGDVASILRAWHMAQFWVREG